MYEGLGEDGVRHDFYLSRERIYPLSITYSFLQCMKQILFLTRITLALDSLSDIGTRFQCTALTADIASVFTSFSPSATYKVSPPSEIYSASLKS